MSRYSTLREIESLDPVRDHARIYFLSTGIEFSWDTVRALEIALYRTYCVPSVSALLDKTGEFRLRAQKRYDDTSLIISDICEYGYDSERGREAIRRMNSIHNRFQIANDDYLYVLSTFIFVPIRWMDRFGWRKMCRHEKLATFYFWREVGRRMAIKEIPETYEEFERFHDDYERRRFRYTDSNRAIGTATRELFVRWLPRPFAPLVRRSINALLDDAMIEAFGFPRPSRFMRAFMSGSLRLRGRVIRRLPPRKKPHFFSHDRNRTYPDGYRVSELGPADGVERDD